jgi:hypothetical protein
MDKNKFTKDLNSRDLLMLCDFLYERLQRGQNFISAARESISQVYPLLDISSDETLSSLLQLLETVPANAEDIKNLIAPGACPHIVTGSFLKENSAFATVSLQGAVLLALFMDQSRFSEAAHLSDLALETAAQYFIETTSFQDYQLRLQWLRHIATQYPERAATATSAKISQAISTMLSHPLAQSMFDLHTKLAALLNVSRDFLNSMVCN